MRLRWVNELRLYLLVVLQCAADEVLRLFDRFALRTRAKNEGHERSHTALRPERNQNQRRCGYELTWLPECTHFMISPAEQNTERRHTREDSDEGLNDPR